MPYKSGGNGPARSVANGEFFRPDRIVAIRLNGVTTFSSISCPAREVFHSTNFHRYAERLIAELPGEEEPVYLFALAAYHSNEVNHAYYLLQGCKQLPEARYLLAKCCFALTKWEEAEDALAPRNQSALWPTPGANLNVDEIPE